MPERVMNSAEAFTAAVGVVVERASEALEQTLRFGVEQNLEHQCRKLERHLNGFWKMVYGRQNIGGRLKLFQTCWIGAYQLRIPGCLLRRMLLVCLKAELLSETGGCDRVHLRELQDSRIHHLKMMDRRLLAQICAIGGKLELESCAIDLLRRACWPTDLIHQRKYCE